MKATAKLYRKQSTGDGVFGTLCILRDDTTQSFVSYTLEPALNDPTHPPIPAGKYRCSRYPSKRFGETYIVEKTEPRTGILFHWGNFYINPTSGEKETLGCVILGYLIETVRKTGVMGVFESRKAFRDFMKYLKGINEFELEIIEEF